MRSMRGEQGGQMRVHLKGIHRVKVKLANGATAEYYYAWRGGPRLVGAPGSPEFLASYTAAHQSRREPDGASFHSVIAGYKASEDFRGLQPRTKSDYLKLIAKIEKAFGTLPLGHSMHAVDAILDKYLARTDKIALAAIAKLERGQTRTSGQQKL